MKLNQYISTPLLALSLATIASIPYVQAQDSYAQTDRQVQRSLSFTQVYAKLSKQYPNPTVISSYVDDAKQKPIIYFELFNDGKVVELDVDPSTNNIQLLKPEYVAPHTTPKISLNEAISVAENTTNATAISVELDQEDDTPVYLIVLESDNKQYFVVMHANNAKILESEQNDFESNYTSNKINLAQAISLAEAETGGQATQAFLDFGPEANNTNQIGVEMLINNQLHLVTVDTRLHKVTHSSFNENKQLLQRLTNTDIKLSPLDSIVINLKKRFKGRFVSSELMLVNNKLTYGISMVRGNKNAYFSVDAQNGKVLKTETLHITDFE